MNIHYLQHVPFEGLGNIESWAISQGHNISKTQLFKNEPFPDIAHFDWLIIMGGPMSTYDENLYSWLTNEKRFIQKAIQAGKFVIGICLGSQLIADVLGAKVYQGCEKEIGWFPISLTQSGRNSSFFSRFPQTIPAFHWHGDTFDIPAQATHLAYSEGCPNQAFSYENRVVGLQFHLESTPSSVKQLATHCKKELLGGKYIQTYQEITSPSNHFQALQNNLTYLLNACEDER